MQDKVQKMTPEIRFKGYTDDWVLRKLGEVVNITMGQSPSSVNYTDDSSYDVLVQGNADLKNGWVIPRVWTKQVTKKGKRGDIILSVRAPVGEVAKTSFDVVLGRGVASVTGNEFVYQALLRLKTNGYWRRLSTGSTFESINSNDIKNANLFFTEKNEQQAIGSLFKKIDNLIVLQQRKIDTLKLLKKALLQQMFPEKEEDIPKVRFTNFTVKWGQQKLKSILILRNEQMTENKEYLLKSFVKNKGIISKSERYDRSFLLSNSNKKYKKTELSDFIYSSNNLETGSIGINRTGKALISPVYSIFYAKHHIYSEFIGLLSTKKKFINDMIRLRQGVIYGQWKIRESDFLEIVVQMPSKSEMKFITNFMFNIDLAIDIYNKKLNKFRVVKESLLQKMFL